jgi:UDP-N-acetylmuramoyl-L-alanyl-D-glutamate--2,6-diaminopimelate ligase
MLIGKVFPQKLKNIYHLARAIFANFLYGFPSWNIKVIGVTGTNGKTTTCQMIAGILEEAGFKVALSSTINFKISDKVWVNKTKFTTLSPFAVQKFILQAMKAGCQYLVLETSSHSLDQNRVWGIKYDTVVVTNITREHLDYHKTMKEYRKAKLKLFKMAKAAVVNLDMEANDEFLDNQAENIYGYSTQSQNLKVKNQNYKSKVKIVLAEDIKLGDKDTSYMIQDTKFQLNLLGQFNIENALAAICVGLNYGISLETSAKALEKIKGVPGRMEYVENDKELNIIVDYAVTPDSLEKLYQLILKIKEIGSPTSDNKIIAVFGSCGERDRGKRPIMGKIVSRFADYIIVTNEDPYGEDPADIINEVFKGVVSHNFNKEFPNFQFPISNFQSNSNDKISNYNKKFEGENCWRILDRRIAIKKALQIAKPGDYVIVTGKGAEETMAVGKKRISWNDKKVILEELEKIESK